MPPQAETALVLGDDEPCVGMTGGAHEAQGFPSDTWRGRPEGDLIKRAYAGIDRRHFDIAETFQIESRPFGIVDTREGSDLYEIFR